MLVYIGFKYEQRLRAGDYVKDSEIENMEEEDDNPVVGSLSDVEDDPGDLSEGDLNEQADLNELLASLNSLADSGPDDEPMPETKDEL